MAMSHSGENVDKHDNSSPFAFSILHRGSLEVQLELGILHSCALYFILNIGLSFLILKFFQVNSY